MNLAGLLFIFLFLWLLYVIIKRAVRVGINQSLLVSDEQRNADYLAKAKKNAEWLEKSLEDDQLRDKWLKDEGIADDE